MNDVQVSAHGALTEILEDWDSAVGRTIASVHEESSRWNDFIVVRFSDGAGILLRRNAESFRYDGEPWVPDRGLYGGMAERVYFGLVRVDWYLRQIEEDRARAASAAYSRERAEYDRLKAKFGD